MANRIRLEIVTPEARTYSEEVDMVYLPGSEGEIGIYPNHIPLMTGLRAGELRVLKDGKEIFLAVGEGFAEVTGEHISVLTDMAVNEDSIDENAAEAAIARAEAALKEKQDISEEEAAYLHATLKNSLAQLRVKRRRAL